MADFNGAFANAPYGSEAVPFPDSGGEQSSVYRIRISAARTFVGNP